MKILPINQKFFTLRSHNPKQVAFRGFDCPEDSFEIKRVYNLSCPICGRPMIQQNQIDAFVSACQDATGDNLIKLLSKYRKYFHDTELKVADILTYQATLYPELDILQLSSQYLQEHIKTMKAEQLDVVEKIPKYAGNLSSAQKMQMEAIVKKYTYIIQNESEKFNKAELENEINTVIPKFHSSKKKIQKQIRKLPTANDDEYRFLKRYGEKSKAELASKLLTPSLSTCEHIKPKSALGANNTENYLAQCQECNSSRNDTPFLSWITGKLGIADNITKYIQTVAGKIESGEISSDYVDYPADIAKTIAIESNGKIRPEVPNVVLSQDAVKISFESKIQQLKKSIGDLNAELEKEKKLQVKSKNSQQFRLYLEYVELQKEQSSLNSQKQSLLQSQKRLTGIINNYYSSVIEFRDLQGKINGISNSKDLEKAKNKIVSLQRNITVIKIEEKEAELDEINAQIAQVSLKLNNINYRIQNLAPRINFSSQYQSMINDIKVEIFELSGLLNEVSKKKDVKAEIEKLNASAREKEKKIKDLTEQNSALNPNDEDGNNIKEYRTMLLVVSRADELREKLQKSMGKEFLDADDRIFEYAKQTASQNIKQLTLKSPAVKRYINLEEIEKNSEELKQLYAKIEQLNIQLAKFAEIQREIDSRKTLTELNRELATLNIKLAGAKEVEASVDVEQRIQSLEEEIERKTAILEKIENKEMSEEDFIKIFSEV